MTEDRAHRAQRFTPTEGTKIGHTLVDSVTAFRPIRRDNLAAVSL